MKYVIVLCLIGLVTFVAGQPPCLGCPTKLEGDDIKKSEEVLKSSLSKLAAGDGPVYELVKINSASTQVVSGSKDVINADLKDKDDKIKNCDIEIWSQPWLKDGIQVTFKCSGEDELVKKHSA